ncbi:putative Zn-finger protein [Sulfuritortus calidifontis]|uniref:Putative Zn-finger protein n=1 Tax=Sulfuritortus calidifontis TaxID=1914471 RepID=A0A4R3JXS5_9PROT|nr:zinc-finger domain-containing protein [Sulfuritortus calidifontis]TCS73332.1 putative Zn-finger protein [Sulfuritortus calidifontis]
MSQTLHTARVVEVTEKDLPLHCPLPAETVWNAHPRVFLPVEQTGEARCPYCGTLYRLKGGPVVGHHH